MLQLKNFLCNTKGSIAIEYAFVVIPFIISILFIMEICRVTYIMSSVDLILSESSSATSTLSKSSDSSAYFRRMAKKMSQGSPLLLFGDMEIKKEVTYCANFEELTTGTCTSNSLGSNPLGIYKIEVPYKPLFFIFPASYFQNKMVRKIILIQENNLSR
ncbi:pilus assembly protein [Klebsiella sp. RHBSTW-00465]|uniref:TadE/TadG family type IV pilus assembly protein n=1 Tax=Klebsiella sp. RHBSTW-00465 TaxID=2742650 RepID=UPI0015F467A6|nr:pilus assembly protein [Klebsiella sp. RHBSTW-00465]MBA7848241.1 pilus assembly protein [Klebsiella sp. RHBSTW-00465]